MTKNFFFNQTKLQIFIHEHAHTKFEYENLKTLFLVNEKNVVVQLGKLFFCELHQRDFMGKKSIKLEYIFFAENKNT